MKIKNQNLVVKRARTGLGLFTLKRIPANRRIIEYTGTLLKGEEVERLAADTCLKLMRSALLTVAPAATPLDISIIRATQTP